MKAEDIFKYVSNLETRLAGAESAYDVQHKAHVSAAADRDRLAARVAKLEAEVTRAKSLAGFADTRKERDRLAAQVAELEAKLSKAANDAEAARRNELKAVCEMQKAWVDRNTESDRANRALAELAAERERVKSHDAHLASKHDDKCEALADIRDGFDHIRDCKCFVPRAEAEAANREGAKFAAQAAAAVLEAEAAKAELAKMRADRAVIDAWNNNQKIECRLIGTDAWHPCDDPMWCYRTHEYRIRAAGVEVES